MNKARDLIAKNLVRLREAAKLTQSELAELAGLSPKMIQKLEYKETNPSSTTLDKISKALGAPLTELFSVAEGGTIPAEYLNKGAISSLKQVREGKRKRAEAQMLGARGKPIKVSADLASPDDFQAGFDFVAKFAGQERDIQLTAMALVFEETAYLKQLSPEFRERLVQLLLSVKI